MAWEAHTVRPNTTFLALAWSHLVRRRRSGSPAHAWMPCQGLIPQRLAHHVPVWYKLISIRGRAQEACIPGYQVQLARPSGTWNDGLRAPMPTSIAFQAIYDKGRSIASRPRLCGVPWITATAAIIHLIIEMRLQSKQGWEHSVWKFTQGYRSILTPYQTRRSTSSFVLTVWWSRIR